MLLGMNPGPWGMLQTGVPFGEIAAVRDWLGIDAAVEQPRHAHPKRPVTGFACRRSEVSGRRLWGWARETFGTPEILFRRFFVWNYCPLAFFDDTGRNITPDRLKKKDREGLFGLLDETLRRTARRLETERVIGIGRFAATRAESVFAGSPVTVGRITHPSPANPRANRGWADCVRAELEALGIRTP